MRTATIDVRVTIDYTHNWEVWDLSDALHTAVNDVVASAIAERLELVETEEQIPDIQHWVELTVNVREDH
jgi:hypothetical protein